MYVSLLANTIKAKVEAARIYAKAWGLKIYASTSRSSIFCTVKERPAPIAEAGYLFDEVSGLPLYDAVTGLMLMA